MKAQSFFGGTQPKATGVKATVAKAQTGTQKVSTPHIVRKTKVKQVGTTRTTSGNNHQMHRDATLTTKKATARPNLPGKEDNRTVWK